MPALALDLGDRADIGVADSDPRVLLQVVDIGQLRLDDVGAWATALGTGQRQRVQSSPAASGCRVSQGHDDGNRRGVRRRFRRVMIRLPSAETSSRADPRRGRWESREAAGG